MSDEQRSHRRCRNVLVRRDLRKGALGHPYIIQANHLLSPSCPHPSPYALPALARANFQTRNSIYNSSS